MHRNLGVFTTRGVDLARLFRQLFGRDGGFTRGRDRTFHFGLLESHIVGMISHLGAMLPVADGLALAAQLKGTRQVAAAFTGDGATSEGDFHEAVNLAAVWKLPVLFVIENNCYGLSTPATEQYACRDLADRGVGLRDPGRGGGRERPAGRPRRGHARPPSARGAATGRRSSSSRPSACAATRRRRAPRTSPSTSSRSGRRRTRWCASRRCCTSAACSREGDIDRLRAALKVMIDTLVDEALTAPLPESTAEREIADVFAPAPAPPAPPLIARPRPTSTEMRYVDAIRDGLREAMRLHPRLVLMGQDIAEYGGVFKVTEGFVEEFGKARVRNTPIIESGAVGAALGLALDGFPAMVEMQFGDFITCGFNQIVNNLAKTHYRWGAAVPVVIRAPVGGGVGAGPFHSQNVESWFTSVAGLKVVAPATAADAKGLLLASVEDGNPVLYLEHKFLYRSSKEQVPAGRVPRPARGGAAGPRRAATRRS